jgi:hypothetical protein
MGKRKARPRWPGVAIARAVPVVLALNRDTELFYGKLRTELERGSIDRCERHVDHCARVAINAAPSRTTPMKFSRAQGLRDRKPGGPHLK